MLVWFRMDRLQAKGFVGKVSGMGTKIFLLPQAVFLGVGLKTGQIPELVFMTISGNGKLASHTSDAFWRVLFLDESFI